jgi:PAS domain S-box-containing protein
LHLAQKRFSDLLGALPIGIILARADGQIESVNKPIVELFGYSEKELIGANISKLFFHPPWANSAGLLEWYEKQGQNLIELRGLALGNEVVPIDLGVRLLNAERTDRLLLVVQDVTERFISNQVKRGFFQMINHDLRSPLTNVVMFLKMMEKREDFGTLTPIGRERLMAAALNVDRILHLADDLLQLESLESAVDKMKMEKIDVEHLIEQAIKSVTETAAAKSITIERQIEDGIQSLTGDAFRLEQVLVNLLSNGIGYSKPGLAMKLVVRASRQRARRSRKRKIADFREIQTGFKERGRLIRTGSCHL